MTIGCFIGCFFAVFGSYSLAGDNRATVGPSYTLTTEGSTPTHRSQTDTSPAEVYIYVGGSFPAGTNLVSFQFLFDLTTAGNTSGYITPLLLERTAGEVFTIYTVRGIGKGFKASLNPVPQSIPFTVIEGTKVPTNENFTFGFINALVNSSGASHLTSPGVIDFNNPGESGQGVGGPQTTNDWVATNVGPPPNTPIVALGTTFGASGAGADYSFLLPYRTYSARASGIVAAP